MLKGIHPAKMRCCSTMNQAMIRASAQALPAATSVD
jgi:hypothetical protein